MKHYLKLPILLLLLTIKALCIKSQCIANAGTEKVVCVGWSTMDTVIIGGNPTIPNGTPPYTYKWETSFTFGSFTLTASDFLNDTSIANPSIINSGPNELTFYLTVIDSLKNSCIDSVKIQFSQFGQTLEDKQRTIIQGGQHSDISRSWWWYTAT